MLLRKTILVIDGNAPLRDAMSDLIKQNGEFAPATAPDIRTAIEFIGTSPVDLIVLDLDTCCEQACGESPDDLRNGDTNIPVLMLASKPVGGNQGTDGRASAFEFLKKPFSIRDLYARIHAMVRNHERAGYASFPVGGYSVDPFKMHATCPDRNRVPLTEKEIKMLQCLHRAGGEFVSKDELKRHVFGYISEIDTHTAATHVNKLRKKLEKNPKNPQFILTERGGYRLVR